MSKQILIIIMIFFISKLQAQYYYNGQFTIDSCNRHYRILISDRAPNPKLHGIYYWYKAGHIHSSQNGYAGQVLDGPYSVTDPKNNLVEQGFFLKGRKYGLWKSWYTNQKLKSSIYYFLQNDIQNIILYDTTGVIVKKGTSKRGLFTGVVVEKVNGESITRIYKNGKMKVSKNNSKQESHEKKEQ